MKVAVVGCLHGELSVVYNEIRRLEIQMGGDPIDLLIICGDFQAVRVWEDLEWVAIPQHHRKLGDFGKYYRQEVRPPCLTIFVGGNHECPHILGDLYFGGWVAPDIFYLGHSGVIRVGPLRIAGLSGIYKMHDFTKGYFETPPYDDRTKRSAYHVREYEVKKLSLVKERVNVCISHDWPACIHDWGDGRKLMKDKPFFAEEMRDGILGNPATMDLLKTMKPDFWFAGHLHVKFAALIPHETEEKKEPVEAPTRSASRSPPRPVAPSSSSSSASSSSSSSSSSCNGDDKRGTKRSQEEPAEGEGGEEAEGPAEGDGEGTKSPSHQAVVRLSSGKRQRGDGGDVDMLADGSAEATGEGVLSVDVPPELRKPSATRFLALSKPTKPGFLQVLKIDPQLPRGYKKAKLPFHSVPFQNAHSHGGPRVLTLSAPDRPAEPAAMPPPVGEAGDPPEGNQAVGSPDPPEVKDGEVKEEEEGLGEGEGEEDDEDDPDLDLERDEEPQPESLEESELPHPAGEGDGAPMVDEGEEGTLGEAVDAPIEGPPEDLQNPPATIGEVDTQSKNPTEMQTTNGPGESQTDAPAPAQGPSAAAASSAAVPQGQGVTEQAKPVEQNVQPLPPPPLPPSMPPPRPFYQAPPRNRHNRPQPVICFDPEWLSILKANHALLPTSSTSKMTIFRQPSEEDRKTSEEALRKLAPQLRAPYEAEGWNGTAAGFVQGAQVSSSGDDSLACPWPHWSTEGGTFLNASQQRQWFLSNLLPGLADPFPFYFSDPQRVVQTVRATKPSSSSQDISDFEKIWTKPKGRKYLANAEEGIQMEERQG
uniref:Calcineurin-like phosphoesterase domain-containing protein n=1 Tax=Chromera velia CCMP2878 TaxID=1169474 RepID=A0A0G4HUX9_9ALVE|eukprot:Cvel_8693.t1-p1 / transcript=Cvel_8693.t1 / gene=Cvel_8693 / organism=Chromera_velia_CCMP2878 / gene_product=Lariat debranching enzyme, putative / transcript_product=Lariat debranching enzyme, putative / location=Cvel_scaffold485:21611-29589(-) / protein_length=815 / sequence_SO=supercontig / SO=protein_coding / is_pseudo=false